jgi:Protein of unknown function (DUF3352)
MIKARLVLPVVATATALAVLAGCGGGGSSSGPSSVAPPDTPVFVEARIQPTGELKADVEAMAERVAGVDDLGATVVSYLEGSALDSDRPVDLEKEIQPWLGETAGLFLTEFDGGDFGGGGIAVEVTDTAAAQEFIDRQSGSKDPRPTVESYEGHDYKLDPDDEDAVGIVGDLVVFGQDRASFEAAVDAADGESLADTDAYDRIAGLTPAEFSLADVYVDIGGLIESAGSGVDPEVLAFLESGLALEDSAAAVSLIPGSDNVEIRLTAGLGLEEGDDALPDNEATELLGSMPAGSIAAVSAGNLGAGLGKVVDMIDKKGIPGEVPAGRFKSTFKQVGLDLDRIAENIGDAAAFALGTSRATLGGALVIEARDASEARDTVASVGTLLRASETPGVTAVSGEASGFSVRSDGLGDRPLVVAAKGNRVAVGYGLPATLVGLKSASGPTLAKTRAYNEAVDALGTTPISGFAAGAQVLRVVEGVLSDAGDREKLEELAPYLRNVPYLAIGAEAKEEVARLSLILGVTK